MSSIHLESMATFCKLRDTPAARFYTCIILWAYLSPMDVVRVKMNNKMSSIVIVVAAVLLFFVQKTMFSVASLLWYYTKKFSRESDRLSGRHCT